MSLAHIALLYLIVGESLCVLVISLSGICAEARRRNISLAGAVCGSAIVVVGWPVVVITVMRERA
jgi:hypothetical protein